MENARDRSGVRSESQRYSVLFVCMGNICRSPLARGVFSHLVRERGVEDGFVTDSCGTGGWHVGSDADPRTLLVAKKYGIELSHRARQLSPLYDTQRFDHILGMDEQNLQQMAQAGIPSSKVKLLREYDPLAHAEAAKLGRSALEVPDPYYGGADGFERMYVMIRSACEGLLNSLLLPPTRLESK